MIHADLPRYGLGTDGTGSAGPALSGRPVHASVRPCSDSGRGSCGEWAAMAGRRRPSPEASAGERQGRGSLPEASGIVRGIQPESPVPAGGSAVIDRIHGISGEAASGRLAESGVAFGETDPDRGNNGGSTS